MLGFMCVMYDWIRVLRGLVWGQCVIYWLVSLERRQHLWKCSAVSSALCVSSHDQWVSCFDFLWKSFSLALRPAAFSSSHRSVKYSLE